MLLYLAIAIAAGGFIAYVAWTYYLAHQRRENLKRKKDDQDEPRPPKD